MARRRLTQTFDEVQEILNAVDGKVDKVEGKGLSTNDYSDAEKAKLAGIEAGAEVNVQADWNQSDNTKDDYIKNKTHWDGPGSLTNALLSWTGNTLTRDMPFVLSGTGNGGTQSYGLVNSFWDTTTVLPNGTWIAEIAGHTWKVDIMFRDLYVTMDDNDVFSQSFRSGTGTITATSPIDLGVSIPIVTVHKLDNKYLDLDSAPTSGSGKPVTSGGVYTALAGKQDTINDLETIRSGAAAGATAYQKPVTGIPSTDIAPGVIPDVSNFITKSVNDLVNYYLKTETYTQTEVNNLIGAIQSFHYEIAASTSAVTDPQGNVLYLIGPTGSGADKYEEYVYSSNTWVKIGDTSVDLSGYVTTSALNTALADYTTTSDLTTLLSGKQDTISDLQTIRSGASAGATAYQKPSGGIPKTDLAEAVQTSLGKADTALQSFTESDPVFGASAAAGITSGDITNWNGKTSNTGTVTSVGVSVPTGLSVSGTPVTTSGTIAVSMASGYAIPTTSKQSEWDGKYSKPSGGIPDTDLTSAVQTSLGKADTAYQKPSDGIPSTDMTSAVQTSLGLADTAYQKPSGGIPLSDLATPVESFYFIQGSSSRAGNGTKGTYLSTKWEGTIQGVSAAYNGLKIAYRIATNTGVGTAGAVLSIDGTNYYPVVIQKNTVVGTMYPVGATILAVFNSTQTANAYMTSNTKTVVTGCWQIMEYDSNTNTYQREYVSSDDTEYAITTRYNTTTGESYYAEYGRYSEGVTLNPSTNTITASKFKVSGGTSSQFLKADGTTDSNTYALASAVPSAPGTLNTDNATAQSVNASEALSGTVNLHKVSKTGDYGDLLNKPTIPAAQVNSDWNASSGVAQILNKPTIPDVSGKEDTSNKVTSLSSSSTDTQYPSAKCVYDIIGDVETLLAAL